MMITAFRPTVTDYAPKATASTAANAPADGFVSGATNRLSEVDAMAALALVVKAQVEPKPELPSDLSAAVTAELGESAFTSFEDPRMQTLNGYMRDGWEAPFFDPIATLGEGWTQQERDPQLLFAPNLFTREGQNVTQHLSFDQRNGTTTLHTVHAESFISTRHHQIVQTREGKVTITDERAV